MEETYVAPFLGYGTPTAWAIQNIESVKIEVESAQLGS